MKMLGEPEDTEVLRSAIAHFRRRDYYPQRAPVVTLWTGAPEGPTDDQARILVEGGFATLHRPKTGHQQVLRLTDLGIAARDRGFMVHRLTPEELDGVDEVDDAATDMARREIERAPKSGETKV